MYNEDKPKRKKIGKVAKVFKLHSEGKTVKEISEKLKISERVVRSYIWRAANPEKYKMLLQRYFAKKKQKKEDEKINGKYVREKHFGIRKLTGENE